MSTAVTPAEDDAARRSSRSTTTSSSRAPSGRSSCPPPCASGDRGSCASGSSSSSAAATTASSVTLPTATGATSGSTRTWSCPPACCTPRPGFSREEQRNVAAIYEDFRPGTYDKKARLVDMDENHVEVAINYPNTFPRFAGQGFAERPDKDLALACIRIYNDWMIDEWCGGDAKGRLVPLTLVPLWDPVLAAAEVRRCAAKGSHAIAFSENPSKLGFASLYSGDWDPLWDACRRPTRRCRCTSARRRRCPRPAPTRRSPPRCRSARRTRRARSATGSSPARCRASTT